MYVYKRKLLWRAYKEIAGYHGSLLVGPTVTSPPPAAILRLMSPAGIKSWNAGPGASILTQVANAAWKHLVRCHYGPTEHDEWKSDFIERGAAPVELNRSRSTAFLPGHLTSTTQWTVECSSEAGINLLVNPGFYPGGKTPNPPRT